MSVEGGFTLADTLAHLSGHLPDTLIPAETLPRVTAVARHLPAAVTRRLYLERWLRPGTRRVDLIVRVEPTERDLLVRGAGARFARAWRDDAELEGSVERIWLEFDLEEEPARPRREPRIFVDFRPAFARTASLDLRLAAAVRVTVALTGQAPSHDLMAGLRRCLESLPAGASLPYLCVDPEGPPERLRVCVLSLGCAVEPYLDAVGWRGERALLREQVLLPLSAACAEGRGPTVLHLDLEGEPAARVGLEFPFARGTQARGALAERGLLDVLVERGSCEARTRDALLEWPGRSVELLPHEIWLSQVDRHLSHVKVTAGGGRPPEAKAYLSVTHGLKAGGSVLGTRPLWFGGGP